MKIEITADGFIIDGNVFTFPLHSSALTEKLGEAVFDKAGTGDNDSYVWNNLGIYVLATKEEGIVKDFRIKLTSNAPSYYKTDSCFNGENLIIAGKNYADFFEIDENDSIFKDLVLGRICVSANIEDDREISGVIVWQKKEKEKKKSGAKKYKFKKAKNPVEFSDFNFKLLVIEELMYNQEILKPKFDLYEFVEEYSEREIDIESEGYDVIPEVVDYFKKLEIEKELLGKIEELYQDGGNEIYGNIYRFWDGEDEQFHIDSFKDVKHLPNLKTITVFDIDPDEQDKLEEKGIEVDYL